VLEGSGGENGKVTDYIFGEFGCGGVCEITMRERGGEGGGILLCGAVKGECG